MGTGRVVWQISAPLLLIFIASECATNPDSRNLPLIHFKYEKFDFNDESATIEWNPAEDCDGNLTYRVIKTLQRQNQPFPTQKTSFNISNDHLEENPDRHHKFFVEALCNDTLYMRSNISLIIPKEVHTVKEMVNPSSLKVCLEHSSFAVSVIWPKSLDSSQGSCICNSWFQVRNCNCISKDNFYGVRNMGEGTNEYKICWSNVTNNMRVHFVVLTPNLVDPGHPFPGNNLEFLTSYKFVITDKFSQSYQEDFDKSHSRQKRQMVSKSLEFKCQEINFNEDYASIAWNSQQCSDTVQYKVVKLSQGQRNSSFTENTSFNFSRTYLNEHTPTINVEAYCNDTSLGKYHYDLIIPSGVKTVDIPVSKSRSKCLNAVVGLTVIWPKSDNFNDGCCVCLWQGLEGCDCYKKETFYDITTEKIWYNETQLCWRNIVNNTKVHFALENIYSTTRSLKFIKSYNFVITGIPSPPNVSVTETLFLCLNDIYDEPSPIRDYIIEVKDITNYTMTTVVQKLNASLSSTCSNIIGLNEYLFQNCSPFNIYANSRNEMGVSESSYPTQYTNNESGICSCFLNNVNPTLEKRDICTSASTMYVARLSCKNVYDNVNSITMIVQLREFSNSAIIKEWNVNCSEVLVFECLDPNTSYYVTMKWKMNHACIKIIDFKTEIVNSKCIKNAYKFIFLLLNTFISFVFVSCI